MKSEIREILNASVKKLYSEEINDFDITRPKFKSHGNWSSNIALILGKELKDQPRKIAKNIVNEFPKKLVKQNRYRWSRFYKFFLTQEAQTEFLKAFCQMISLLSKPKKIVKF